MVKLGVAAMVAFAAMIAPACADQQVWKVDNWPGDIDLIPCSAWSRTADGTWVLTGGAIKLGAETMSNIGVKKRDAAAIKLERSCGKK
jgi:hypothetical protein